MTNTRLALQNHLLNTVTASEVDWENDDFTPPDLNTPYYRANVLFAGYDNMSMDDTIGEISGLFQVTLLFPNDKGTKPLEDKASAIINSFLGVKLIETDTKVRVLSHPYFTVLEPTADRYIGAVSIPFRSVKI